MAQIQILTPDELAERDRNAAEGSGRSAARRQSIATYKRALQGVAAGYGGDVTLAEDEDKPSVRQLLKLAAQDLNVVLAFRRRKDPRRLHFVVLTPEQAAARPRRGGGRRKQQR